MNGRTVRALPYLLSFFSSFCIMILELVASRLVARHVGASLTVWTSVIGIMLGGICLGNVLGGRLADRIEPGRAVGPLYALGAMLTLSCLWLNAVVGLLPGLDTMSWDLRTLVVVTVDFLVPGTVLGMIGPVVAKMAVEQARKSGSAIGDVYFMGAVGSIVGTFFAGFVLLYVLPVSSIVLLVAAALAVLAAVMMGNPVSLGIGLIAALLLLVGVLPPVTRGLPAVVSLGSIPVNPVSLVGQVLTLVLGLMGLAGLFRARNAAGSDAALDIPADVDNVMGVKPNLTDLAVLSFIASLAFMALEMVAGRLVTRHLGSSLYGWTSVIAVMLGGLSLGNFLGGKIADRVRSETQASWLFLAASVMTILVLLLETPPRFLEGLFRGRELMSDELTSSVLSYAISWSKIPLPQGGVIALTWPWRVLAVTAAMFFIPAISMGTVSPVVVKLAVERLRMSKRTGRAIGQVYAWGMVGSILGTFLTGFVLIDVLGTKGVLIVLAVGLAVAATWLGSVWHALWAGIPMGLCLLAFASPYIPVFGPRLGQMGQEWGLREKTGDPSTVTGPTAYVDESNYYFIKVTNEGDAEGRKRTLVLDNLIHGYFLLGHPERLDYDYEHIYGLVAHRIAEARSKAAGFKTPAEAPLSTLFLGGGAYTFQRYMQHKYPKCAVDVAEIDWAVNRANKIATGLLPYTLPPYDTLEQYVKTQAAKPGAEGLALEERPKTLEGGKSSTAKHVIARVAGATLDLGEYGSDDGKAMYADMQKSVFPTIRTVLGDARQFVVKNQGKSKYDIVFGDAFNDFSVPWHLTTLEFNRMIADQMSDDGVYMINIIDAYESQERADRNVEKQVKKENEQRTKDGKPPLTDAAKLAIRNAELRKMNRFGGFLGAWVNTARQTFGNVYIFGTDDTPGSGLRETFVVVASKKPLKLDDLGSREDDPKFFDRDKLFEPRPFPEAHMRQVDQRSRGIKLSDDYAPVENLLAPVAETRGEDD